MCGSRVKQANEKQLKISRSQEATTKEEKNYSGNWQQKELERKLTYITCCKILFK